MQRAWKQKKITTQRRLRKRWNVSSTDSSKRNECDNVFHTHGDMDPQHLCDYVSPDHRYSRKVLYFTDVTFFDTRPLARRAPLEVAYIGLYPVLNVKNSPRCFANPFPNYCRREIWPRLSTPETFEWVSFWNWTRSLRIYKPTPGAPLKSNMADVSQIWND